MKKTVKTKETVKSKETATRKKTVKSKKTVKNKKTTPRKNNPNKPKITWSELANHELLDRMEPGDNARYLAINMELLQLPMIDLKNIDDINKRLLEYFQIYSKYDTKPTVVGLAMALNGMSRTMLRCIVDKKPYNNGKNILPAIHPDGFFAIKKAYILLENLYENYMLNGKLNPVTGIFMGKNHFGYQDKIEHEVVGSDNIEEHYSIEDIRKRYVIEDAEDIEDS